MNNTIANMADNQNKNDDIINSVSDDDIDDFEKMLSDFIAKEFDEGAEEAQQEMNELSENKDVDEDVNISLSATEEKPQSNLAEHEYSLFRAYKNFMYAISMLCQDNDLQSPVQHLTERKLIPHYKKRAGTAVSQDILHGWEIMMNLFPDEINEINPESTDDQLLDFAEQCKNENLQLAVISHVETMIELEGCEIDYESRKLKYERKKLEKEIYEAHQRHIERSRRYIEAIQERNFPINAERLVNNYFRLSNKDPEGSFKALITNPATFSPIDFSKMKDRFFGLIKVKPQDGIRINHQIGEFLKRLKV